MVSAGLGELIDSDSVQGQLKVSLFTEVHGIHWILKLASDQQVLVTSECSAFPTLSSNRPFLRSCSVLPSVLSFLLSVSV